LSDTTVFISLRKSASLELMANNSPISGVSIEITVLGNIKNLFSG
jgi:hypothetical protein